jgi:hypothetical protein
MPTNTPGKQKRRDPLAPHGCDPVIPYDVPSGAADLAWKRCGAMIPKWSMFGDGNIRSLITSAYLQGVNDAVETYYRNGIDFEVDQWNAS